MSNNIPVSNDVIEFFADLLHNNSSALKEIEESYSVPGIEDLLGQRLVKTIKRSLDPNVILSKKEQRRINKIASIRSFSKKEEEVKPRNIPAGSLSAEEFLSLLRSAGKVPAMEQKEVVSADGKISFLSIPKETKNGKPLMQFDAKQARIDEKNAVIGYVGFDCLQPLGVQLDAARRKAYATVAKKMSQPSTKKYVYRSAEAHAEKWETAGWIKGLPNHTLSMIKDLAARERAAVSNIATFSALRGFVSVSDWDNFERMLNKEFGQIDEFILDDEGHETGKMKKVDAPIVSALKAAAAKKDIDENGDIIDRVTPLLLRLEGLAVARLEHIRKDLDELNPSCITPEAVDKVHAAIMGRGLPSFEEELIFLSSSLKE